ncbi:hypothetical protein PIB30_006394 [Stylosanthes scabra]|uniref:F-box associated beta-propeller type 1 domain-containing protein n=1 Tax=Stylosanthes scabra TaxID=79078 RepID=A0ABU6T434_9FABA|nr:hypothetical protein [Stylosanthes scabra]
MCLEIFKRCDAKTLDNVRATSRFWKQTLNSYEFVSEVSEAWKSKGCSFIAHFGFNNKLNSSMDSVMNMDDVYGIASKIELPILTPGNGWYQIIGLENGIFCFHFCSVGHRSYLLAWNPAAGSTKLIPDPPKHYCTKCAFLYTFAYFPNSLHYGIVHLYKKKQRQKTWRLTMYSSAEQNWVVNMTCPDHVRTLDPNYVSLDGVIYWINWRDHDEDMIPTFIVSFSMLSHKFGQILLPAEVRANYHGLFIHHDKLCVGALNYDFETYSYNIWEISTLGEAPLLNKLFTYDGYGHPYLPAFLLDNDVIQVLEKYDQLEDAPYIKHSIFHITRWSSSQQSKYSLKLMEFDNFVSDSQNGALTFNRHHQHPSTAVNILHPPSFFNHNRSLNFLQPLIIILQRR